MKLLILDRKIRKFIENKTLSIVINELKKENVEVKWLLIDPEIKTRDGKKNEINFKDLEDYKTSNVLNILKEEKPDVILLSNDYDFIMRSFIPTAKYLKIPTVLLFGGIIDDETEKMNSYLIKNRILDISKRRKKIMYNFLFMIKNFHNAGYSYKKLLKMIFSELITPFKYYMPFGNYGCDVIVVAGEGWANKLKRLKVKSKIIITGHPQIDLIFNEVSNQKPIIKKDKKTRIILMTTPLVEHGMMDKEEWKILIKDIIKNCLKLNNVELIIKIHPASEKIEKYESILNEMKINLQLYQKEDLGKIISEADIVITYGVSSGTHYGIFLKKPVIVYNPFQMPLDEMPFVREGMATELTDIKKLTDMLKNIKPIEDKKIEKFISKYLYKFDGQSGIRVSKIILELIKQRY